MSGFTFIRLELELGLDLGFTTSRTFYYPEFSGKKSNFLRLQNVSEDNSGGDKVAKCHKILSGKFTED